MKKVCRAGFIAVLFVFLINLFFVQGAEVKITGEKGSWKLLVDGKEFYIQGAGCGLAKGKKGEDYLKLAKELGANCVRTWGIDQGNKEYLDKAREYGLMVDAGIWLDWASAKEGITYIGESKYKKKVREETLDYIKKFKDHPAILMWNVGNEVLFFSESREEKIAFCEFLERLIREIHQIDPGHPVIYTSAAYLNFKYLKEYVPGLDAIGINTYCSIRSIHSNWDFFKFNKPYVITEYGPYLPCDSQRDKNGGAKELGDYQKASIYRNYSRQIREFENYNLGGFVFHLGETTQESMTWWNINEGKLKRQSYWAIYEIYTGKPAPYPAPRIGKFALSKEERLRPGEVIDVEVEIKNADPKDLSFKYRLSTSLEGVLQYYVNQYMDIEVMGSGNKVKIKAPQKKGVYRLYCFVKDKEGTLSSVNKTISVNSDIAE